MLSEYYDQKYGLEQRRLVEQYHALGKQLRPFGPFRAVPPKLDQQTQTCYAQDLSRPNMSISMHRDGPAFMLPPFH